MSLMPRYEVLMPLAPWEHPEVLRESLASLRAQTLLPDRVVVSCDGKPPPGLRRILSHAGLPLEIVEGPGSEGVGPVLARGLMVCTCDLIIRADSDDVSTEHRCQLQIEKMLERPNLAVLSGQVREFNRKPGECVGVRKVPEGSGRIRRFSRWRNPINHPAVGMRRSAVMEAGNYRSCPGFEDYDLWLRLIKRGATLDNLPDEIVWCRVGPAHFARRRGWVYAVNESSFFLRCAREGTLSWPVALALILTRCPIRLLPPPIQASITRAVTGRTAPLTETKRDQPVVMSDSR